jgi:hypothetical protein
MSHEKIIKLASQFMNKLGDSERDKQFQAQREMLTSFYEEFYGRFRRILNEMEGDLFTLKQKNLDKHSLKLFGTIMHRLINLIKVVDPKKPYPGIQAIVNYLRSEETEGVIEDLDFLIQLHLKRNEVEGWSEKYQAKVQSLNKLSWLAQYAKEHMDKNPMLQESYSAPPGAINKEELVQGPEVRIGPLADTVPPPKLQKK